MSPARPVRAERRRAAAGPGRGLERLWAPWRMAWIANAEASEGCLFCRVGGANADRRDLVLVRSPHALLMLNRFPYTSAHLMVAVRRHAAQFRDLSVEERLEVTELTALAERALERAVAPHGVNYGLNVGRVAGAGFPGHLHLHLVPRWNGDTNFMTSVAEARVLPESLTSTWTRLRRAIAELERRPIARRAARPRRGA